MKRNALALDCETFLIKPGEMSPRMVCLSWASLRNGKSGVLHAEQAESFLRKALHTPDMELVFHNAPFDLLVIRRAFPQLTQRIYELLDAGQIRDTAIRQKIGDIATGVYRGYETDDGDWVAHGYSLAALAKRHLGWDLDKTTWRTGYGELYDTPLDRWPAGAIEYARRDSEATAGVFSKQKDFDLVEPDRVWFDFVLYHMARIGLRVEPDRVAELEAKTLKAIRGKEPGLQKAGYLRVTNLKAVQQIDLFSGDTAEPEYSVNTGQVREAVQMQLVKKGIKEIRTSETGLVKIDKVNCRLAGTPNLQKFADYKELIAVRNKDLVFLRKGVEDGAIHTRFDSVLATGRTSSSSPNVQNIRRFPGIRECFVPRPGFVYLDCDYGSAELHTLAQTCLDLFGKSRLAQVLNEGKDAHVAMGANILGCTYRELMGRIESGDKDAKLYRQIAKGPNYGFPGGMGAVKFVEYIEAQGGSWKEAVKIFTADRKWKYWRKKQKHDAIHKDDRVFAAACLKEIWKKTWPETKLLFEYVHGRVEAGQPIVLTRTKRERLSDRFTASCNYLFQGPAADGAALAGRALHNACYRDPANILHGCTLVHFVHDQYMVEAPPEKAEKALDEMVKIMQTEFNRITPDVKVSVDGGIKKEWSK